MPTTTSSNSNPNIDLMSTNPSTTTLTRVQEHSTTFPQRHSVRSQWWIPRWMCSALECWCTKCWLERSHFAMRLTKKPYSTRISWTGSAKSTRHTLTSPEKQISYYRCCWHIIRLIGRVWMMWWRCSYSAVSKSRVETWMSWRRAMRVKWGLNWSIQD